MDLLDFQFNRPCHEEVHAGQHQSTTRDCVTTTQSRNTVRWSTTFSVEQKNLSPEIQGDIGGTFHEQQSKKSVEKWKCTQYTQNSGEGPSINGAAFGGGWVRQKVMQLPERGVSSPFSVNKKLC